MDQFAVNEARTLYFHKVLHDQLRRSPDLLDRARDHLAALRKSQPAQKDVWAEWEVLLAGSFEDMDAKVLDHSAQGGLLRANSPIAQALSGPERNALWQRIGLQQFTGHFLNAVDDLALDIKEQSAMTGIAIPIIEDWRRAPPTEMTQGMLEELKLILAVHQALTVLYTDQDVRRAWLRSYVEVFAAKPIDILMRGDGGEVHRYLTLAAQPLIRPDDMPSH